MILMLLWVVIKPDLSSILLQLDRLNDTQMKLQKYLQGGKAEEYTQESAQNTFIKNMCARKAKVTKRFVSHAFAIGGRKTLIVFPLFT